MPDTFKFPSEESKKLSKDKTQDKNKKSAAKKEEKKPKEPPSPEERRQASRAKISQKGLLSAIGVADGGSGDMADIFGSDSVIGADIGSALKSSKKVGIARSNSGFKTTKKRGFEGSEKIDGVKIADAGKATLDSEKGQAELTGRIVATGFEVSNMSIDRNSVQKVLKRRNRSIQQCYERSLKGEAIEGKIKLTLIIDERGRVVDIKIVEDRLKSADALACILKILKRTKFPKPKDGFAEISKTWVFEASSN